MSTSYVFILYYRLSHFSTRLHWFGPSHLMLPWSTFPFVFPLFFFKVDSISLLTRDFVIISSKDFFRSGLILAFELHPFIHHSLCSFWSYVLFISCFCFSCHSSPVDLVSVVPSAHHVLLHCSLMPTSKSYLSGAMTSAFMVSSLSDYIIWCLSVGKFTPFENIFVWNFSMFF